jgi:hypothetical protein
MEIACVTICSKKNLLVHNNFDSKRRENKGEEESERTNSTMKGLKLMIISNILMLILVNEAQSQSCTQAFSGTASPDVNEFN